MQTKDDVKKLAKKVQKASQKLGYDIKLTHALEIISNVNWDQEWNAVNAQFNRLESKYKEEIDSLKKTLAIEMSSQKKFTLEEIQDKTMNLHIIKRLLLSGALRDKMNLGLLVDKDQFLLEDFTKLPHALFVGSMGSGKSLAVRYSIMNWMIGNSDQTNLFIVDTIKGAKDYEALFYYDQVYSVSSPNQVHGLIDLLYKEYTERKENFFEVDAKNLIDYENKTGKKISRCVSILEEFHHLSHNILNFDKDYKVVGTTASKFNTLMRVGRRYGIWFIGVSQRATATDIHSEIVPSFSNKQVFRISKAEANYILGNSKPSLLKSNQRGKCYSDYGEIQFPFVNDDEFKNLLKEYVVKKESNCFVMTDSLIEEVFSGKVNLSINSMLFNTHDFNNFIKTNLIKDCDIIKEYDNYIVMKNKNELVFSLITNNKIKSKMIQNMIFEMKNNNCKVGIIYSTTTNISTEIYQFANTNNIKIIDYEDINKAFLK